MPVLKRASAGASTSYNGTGRTAFAALRANDDPPARGASTARSSTMVFHSPQPGQRPCHLGLSFPHWEQTKRVFAAIAPT